MWATSWASLFANNTAVRPEPQTSTSLYAAHWSYETPTGETHRISCSHLHRTRRDAETCGSQLMAQVDRMAREHKVIGWSYVAERLYRNGTWRYDGVLREEEIR